MTRGNECHELDHSARELAGMLRCAEAHIAKLEATIAKLRKGQDKSGRGGKS